METLFDVDRRLAMVAIIAAWTIAGLMVWWALRGRGTASGWHGEDDV